MKILFEDLKNFDWPDLKFNMPACKLPSKYAQELKKIFNLPNNFYISVSNLRPLAQLSKKEVPYACHWHVDSHRKSAIYIPISLDNENHYTEFIVDNKFVKVPYTRGVPLLFNVKVRHKINNNDFTINRNMISIGLIDTNFDDLINLYYSNKLINYSNLTENKLLPLTI